MRMVRKKEMSKKQKHQQSDDEDQQRGEFSNEEEEVEYGEENNNEEGNDEDGEEEVEDDGNEQEEKEVEEEENEGEIDVDGGESGNGGGEEEQEEGGEASDANEGEEGGENKNTHKKHTQLLSLQGNEQGLSKGIIYFPSVPPLVGQNTLWRIFGQFGKISHCYFIRREKRKVQSDRKTKGSSLELLKEGWIEYEDKKIAKKVVLSFQGQELGPIRKGYIYSSLLWDIRYLSKVTWSMIETAMGEKWRTQKKKQMETLETAKQQKKYVSEVWQSSKEVRAIVKRKSHPMPMTRRIKQAQVIQNDEDIEEERPAKKAREAIFKRILKSKKEEPPDFFVKG